MRIRYTTAALALALAKLTTAVCKSNSTAPIVDDVLPETEPAQEPKSLPLIPPANGFTVRVTGEFALYSVHFAEQEEMKPFEANFTENDSGVYEKQLEMLGEYRRISVKFDKDFKNQDLQCKLIDRNNGTILVRLWEEQKEGEETTDATGSTFGAGEWDWVHYNFAEAIKVVCDSSFVKTGPEGSQIQVILSNSGGENVTTVMDTLSQDSKDYQRAPRLEEIPSSKGPFTNVELKVGILRKDTDVRCQLIDADGKVVSVERDGGTFTTFSDYNRGAWTVPNMSVSKIICDAFFNQAANGVDVSDNLLSKVKGNATAALEQAVEGYVKVQVGKWSQRTQFQGTSYLFSGKERQEIELKDLPKEVNTIQMEVGFDLPQQDVRCQALDPQDKPLWLWHTSMAGEKGWDHIYNDTTFGMEKPSWTVDPGLEVRKIVCDPTFRSRPNVTQIVFANDPDSTE